MTTITKHDAITAAMDLAEDVANGKASPADIEALAVKELTETLLPPADSGTELHGLRIEVTRRVLSEGGVSADELSEWVAVQRRRENPDADPEAVSPVVALKPADDPDALPDQDSAASEALDAGNDPYADVDLTGLPDGVLNAAADAESDDAAAEIIANFRKLVNQ